MTGTVELRVTLPARADEVEAFVCRVPWPGGVGTREDRFAAELLLRESLANAVAHSGTGLIRCIVRICKRRFFLLVADSGPGFSWQSQPAVSTEVGAASGRGIKIFRLYADHVRFNRSGNLVCITKQLTNGKYEQ